MLQQQLRVGRPCKAIEVALFTQAAFTRGVIRILSVDSGLLTACCSRLSVSAELHCFCSVQRCVNTNPSPVSL